MKYYIMLFLIAVFTNSALSSEIDDDVIQGELEFNYGNRSKGLKIMSSVLETDPENIDALWFLTYDRISSATGRPLDERTNILNVETDNVQKIIQLAHDNSEHGKAYYVSARLAELYNAFERAIDQIDKAIEHDQDSAKYYFTKGRILFDRAEWERDEMYLDEGQEALDHALRILESKGSPLLSRADVYFNRARWHPDFVENVHEYAIDNYKMALETEELTERFSAYAWNNLSIHYREIGDCEKAREAAENALSLFDFGNARNNLFYSKACLDLKESGNFN